jgi:tRNA(adenine34) deaminase
LPEDYISPDLADLDLSRYMKAALQQAEEAGQNGELPIGAVVVIDGEIISLGRARHQQHRSQLRHAELNAILDGGERVWKDYRRAILFTTVEPCPMCLGAAVMADIPHIVFALHDQVVKSDLTIAANPYVRRHVKTYYGGVMAVEAAAIFSLYDPATLKYIQTGVFSPV